MSRRSVLISVLSVGAVLGGAALTPAAQAAPSASDLSLTGKFSVWIEPKPTDTTAAQWTGCVTELPTLSVSVKTEGRRPLPQLQFIATVPRQGGVVLPTRGLIGFLTPSIFLPADGPQTIASEIALGIGDYKTVPTFPANVVSGRVTLYTTLYFTTKWFGANFPTFKPLPVRSVPFQVTAKPEGACSEPGAGVLSLFLANF